MKVGVVLMPGNSGLLIPGCLSANIPNRVTCIVFDSVKDSVNYNMH